jgi:hypothetical protein
MPIPPSAYDWPKLLAFAAEWLPLAAAWRAGRLRAGDPAGQVGITWGLMAASYPVSLLALLVGGNALAAWVNVATGIALPLLLAPPLLTWIGPGAKRWQPAVLGAFALLRWGRWRPSARDAPSSSSPGRPCTPRSPRCCWR